MNKLTNLAEMASIASSYIDKTGKTHYTTDDVRKFFLESMGVKTLTKEDIDEGIKKFSQSNLLEEVLAFYEDEKVVITINGDGLFRVSLVDEKGETIEDIEVKGGVEYEPKVEDNVSVGIRGVNLEFDKGEFVAITGESGSGKSSYKRQKRICYNTRKFA